MDKNTDKKVLLPEEVAETGLSFLEERGYVIKRSNKESLDELKRDIADCDALLLRTMQCPAELIDSGKKLKVIGRHGVGTDNIDLEAARGKGVVVTYTPQANSGSVAEHTLALILGTAKNIGRCDRGMHRGDFALRSRIKGVDLEGKTLGVIGLGKIGRLTAIKAARGFDMKVIGYDPYIGKCGFPEEVEYTDEWSYVFGASDFITVHIPATKDTVGLIGEKEFSMMKKSAFFINVSRGTIADEEALVGALERGEIAGAGLDVYAQEPPSPENPLFRLENVVLTPHNASLTFEAMDRMSLHAAQGIHEVLSGHDPTWKVDLPS